MLSSARVARTARSFSLSSAAALFIPLVVFLVRFAAGQQQQETPSVVSDACLACLCEGSSGCNSTIGCRDGGLCGPFLISGPYWADAGGPNGDFSRCVNEPFCAAETVRKYMNKFAQDCDGDGTVNCLDYALIHHRGGYSCVTRTPESDPLYAYVGVCFFAAGFQQQQTRPAPPRPPSPPTGGGGGGGGGLVDNNLGSQQQQPFPEIDLRQRPPGNSAAAAAAAGQIVIPGAVIGGTNLNSNNAGRPNNNKVITSLLTPIAGAKRRSLPDGTGAGGGDAKVGTAVVRTRARIIFP